MTFRRYDADELRGFLAAVDRHLSMTVRIEIIGGAAAALAYRVSSTTSDIFEHITQIHANVALDHDVLLARFAAEMTHVMGDPGELKNKLFDLIDTLFGPLKRVAAERRLRGWPPPLDRPT